MKLIFLFLLSSTLFAKDHISLETGLVKASNNDGDFTNINIEKAFNKKTKLLFSYQNINRIFNDEVKINDKNYSASVFHEFRYNAYLELTYASSPDAQFYATNSLAIIPHYIWRGIDFWAGFRELNYPSDSIKEYRLGLLKEHATFSVGAQYFSAQSDPQANSVHLFFIKDLGKWNHRFDFASGKTIEDDDLVANFNSYSLTSLYQYKENIQIGPHINLYNGAIREEQRYSFIAKYFY